MKSLILALTIAASTTASAAGPADPLTVAKEMYAAAAYEEAFATLTDARKSVAPSSTEAIALGVYSRTNGFGTDRPGQLSHAEHEHSVTGFFQEPCPHESLENDSALV